MVIWFGSLCRSHTPPLGGKASRTRTCSSVRMISSSRKGCTTGPRLSSTWKRRGSSTPECGVGDERRPENRASHASPFHPPGACDACADGESHVARCRGASGEGDDREVSRAAWLYRRGG